MKIMTFNHKRFFDLRYSLLLLLFMAWPIYAAKTEKSNEDHAADYLAAYDAVQRVYSNISIDATGRTSLADGQVTMNLTFSLYLRDDGLIRLDVTDINNANASNSILVTKDNWYSFSKSETDNHYKLAFKRDQKQGRFSVLTLAPFADFSYASGGGAFGKILPTNLPETILAEIKKKATIGFLDVETTNENGICTIIFSHKDALLPFRFTTLPESNWVISKTESSSIDSDGRPSPKTPQDFEAIIKMPQSKTISEATYEGEFEGVPLLKTLTISHYSPESKLKSQTVYTVTKIVPGAPDISLFDTSQFPLAEHQLLQLSPRPIAWWRIAFFVVGLLLIVVGLFLRFKKPKEQS